MNQFFLQREDKIWEEVDERVFKERTRVLGEKDLPRYNGNYIHILDGDIGIHATDLSLVDLAVIMRYFGIKERDCPIMEQGWFQTPAFVKIAPLTNRGKPSIYELGSKQMWKAA